MGEGMRASWWRRGGAGGDNAAMIAPSSAPAAPAAHAALADWLAYIERQHVRSIDMSLDRVREVAARMGLSCPAARTIVVGGTNGKGSTVAFIEAIARAAGWRVGAYTSPHLLRYNERVRIDGVEAGDAALSAAFAEVEAARIRGGEAVPLTYFEFGTLAALRLFERGGDGDGSADAEGQGGAQLDLAVLEVGLGGRLDAVNIVDADVAVITTVDLDHQDWLGDSIEAIGAEKAGIARAWKPLVLGDDDPPSSVLGRAYAIGASALRIGCDFFFDPPQAVLEADADLASDAGLETDPDVHPGSAPDAATPGGRDLTPRWQWRELGCTLALPLPPLSTPVQLRNAAVAIAALRALPETLPERAFAEGVAVARLPGRLQRFVREGVEVLVDVGHNPQAARALAAALTASPRTGRVHAVYAALADKDAVATVAALAEAVDVWHLAGLAEHGPRGQGVDAFAARLAGTAAGAGLRHADVASALDAALAAADPGDRLLVFGSFHTAAAGLARFGRV